MDEELQLKYLYFLTHMSSGTERWKATYDAWTRFGHNMDTEKYSEMIDNVRAFHKKYAIKKKTS